MSQVIGEQIAMAGLIGLGPHSSVSRNLVKPLFCHKYRKRSLKNMRDILFQQVLVTHPKHVFVYDFHTLFFNLACFWYPKRCTRVHRLVLKNDPNYVNFFTRMISTLKYKWPPRDSGLLWYTLVCIPRTWRLRPWDSIAIFELLTSFLKIHITLFCIIFLRLLIKCNRSLNKWFTCTSYII